MKTKLLNKTLIKKQLIFIKIVKSKKSKKVNMNFWLLALLIFEFVFTIISFSVSMISYSISFLETVNLVGNIFSIQGVILGIIFLILQNRQNDTLGEHIIEIRRTVTN